MVGDVQDAYLSKVGLSRYGAQRRELRADKLHPIVVVGMLVFKCFQHLGRIVSAILHLMPQLLQVVFRSVHLFVN